MPTSARYSVLTVFLLLAACSDDSREGHPVRPSAHEQARTEGETRVEVAQKSGARVSLRTGPKVEVALPDGFTIYPGAVIVSNTLVERSKNRRMLLEFVTRESPETIVSFYRRQAEAARLDLRLDLTGPEGGGLGGMLGDGRTLSIAVRPRGSGSHVVIAIE